MKIAEPIFWVCFLLLAYTYFLYPALLFLAYALAQIRRDLLYLYRREDRRAPCPSEGELPGVSLIIPVYNEEARLPEKIENIARMAYPREKLQVIFVSDGSADRSNEILERLRDSNFRLAAFPVRKGKPTALNLGVGLATHQILIFSDAATLFAPDAMRKLVRHFSDPRVGCVCGALHFRRTDESRQTEGVYWKYESMLRLMEGRLRATLTASGAIYALRRECFQPLPPDTVLDDFVVPLNVRKQGYRVLYDPEAIATEFAASSVAGEFTRRVRLAGGSFSALGEFLEAPLEGFAWLAFLSHKVLRWIVPFLLLGLLASSAFLSDRPVFRALLLAQLLFYFWAALGFFFRGRVRRIRYALLGYFLVAMNVAFLVGFIRALSGRKEAKWERVT